MAGGSNSLARKNLSFLKFFFSTFSSARTSLSDDGWEKSHGIAIASIL